MPTETSQIITTAAPDENITVSNELATELPNETSVIATEQISAISDISAEAAMTETSVNSSAQTGSSIITSETFLTVETTSETISETEIAMLPPETAVISTEITTVTEAETPIDNNTSNSLLSSEQAILIIVVCFMLLVIGILFGTISRRKKSLETPKSKISNGQKSAKERDIERLAGKKKKSDSKKSSKKAKAKIEVSKDVLGSLPYKKVLDDNLWYLGNKLYSKAYTFDDINFNLADEDEQYAYLERYIDFLNTLDNTIDAQICCWNCKLKIDKFREKTLMKAQDDDYFALRYEYNTRVLEENIRKGQNAIQKHMCVTLTINAADDESAYRKFKSLDISTTNVFNLIGPANMRVMTSQERIEVLKDFYIGTEQDIPAITDEQFEIGEEKIFCAPDYLEFKRDYFLFNNSYARAIFIKDYPQTASSDIIEKLLKTGLEFYITLNISAYDTAKAKKLIQQQITSIDTNMAQRERKASSNGNFASQMPQRIKNQRDSLSNVYDKLDKQDQKLFMCNVIIIIKANSYDELTNNTNIINDVLKTKGCMSGELAYQQEHGMFDGLPCGYQRRVAFKRSMPSESVGILMPFNAKEMQMSNATYYGLNKLSNNMITFDRVTGLKNPSGFFLGCPGTGKSFIGKREMLDVILRNPNADILIIDPESEYQGLVQQLDGTVVRFASGSKTYINPFEFDFALLVKDEDDEDYVNIIDQKCALITSFISCMDEKNPLTAQEKSFVDRCVRKSYLRTGVLDSLDKNDMPTLSTFMAVVREETEFVTEEMKNKILLTIDMYVNGSANYFNNPTNVDAQNRIISYDIKDLSGTLKTQGMLLILDYIWNRLSANRYKGRLTYVYIDEIYILFADEYCLDYLRMLWKRARKYGGVLTGITQNVEDVLKDDKSRTMLSNSEFLILLNQNPVDAQRLQKILHFSNQELNYLNDVPAGHGVIVIGSGGKVKIPFYDEFPKDTELYKKMSTNFSEIAKQKKKISELKQ